MALNLTLEEIEFTVKHYFYLFSSIINPSLSAFPTTKMQYHRITLKKVKDDNLRNLKELRAKKYKNCHYYGCID